MTVSDNCVEGVFWNVFKTTSVIFQGKTLELCGGRNCRQYPCFPAKGARVMLFMPTPYSDNIIIKPDLIHLGLEFHRDYGAEVLRW